MPRQTWVLMTMPGVPQKDIALRGQHDAPVGAVKDGQPEFLFQLMDGVGQAGLGNVEFLQTRTKNKRPAIPNRYCQHTKDTFYPPVDSGYNDTAANKMGCIDFPYQTREAFRYGTNAK